VLVPAIAILVTSGIVVGIFVRSWLGLALPCLIPVVYAGLANGWWGSRSDLGDAWAVPATIVTILAIAGCGAAIALGRVVAELARGPRMDAERQRQEG
jgi:hypothetical protein